MENSISTSIQEERKSVLEAAKYSDRQIAEHLNSTLNKFLQWPAKALPAIITDAEGDITHFDCAISITAYEESEIPRELGADKVACAIHVTASLGKEELNAGYEHIAAFKRLKRPAGPQLEYPINKTSIGVILAMDSPFSVEEIGELMKARNELFPPWEWPDMVAVLKSGTVNYVCQIHGGEIMGSFYLPGYQTGGPVPPMYIHIFAHGLGIYTLNNVLHFIFGHLASFSPGIKLPSFERIMEGAPMTGITVSAYLFDRHNGLVSLAYEEHLNRQMRKPFPYRIEDGSGSFLSHVSYIPWPEGGAVKITGKFPLEAFLLYLGPVAKDAHIYKQADGAISSVLPINENDFRGALFRFQCQSNMKVQQEKPSGVILKYADEGTDSPFMARLFMGILNLRDRAFSNEGKRLEFDEAYKFVFDALTAARTAHKEIIQTVTEHRRKVSQGEIARVEGGMIHIAEDINGQLSRQLNDFLYSAVRCIKDGMQKLVTLLQSGNIGFLFKKQKLFEKELSKLAMTKPELAEYLRNVRDWSDKLVTRRNKLHEGWFLPLTKYNGNGNIIEITEPEIEKQPVSEFVGFMFDRLCCFVEEITVYGLQSQMPQHTSITEIKVQERKENCKERFRTTLLQGGMPAWKLTYHRSSFEES